MSAFETNFIKTTARHAGICCICGQSIYKGDPIYEGINGDNPVAAHDRCVCKHANLRPIDNPTKNQCIDCGEWIPRAF